MLKPSPLLLQMKKFKLVFLGEQSVGKTSLITRFVRPDGCTAKDVLILIISPSLTSNLPDSLTADVRHL